MFFLHNTRGAATRLPCGLYIGARSMMYADDGFGNYINVDPVLAVYSVLHA